MTPNYTIQQFYGHYAGQPVLAGTPVKNLKILLKQGLVPADLDDDN